MMGAVIDPQWFRKVLGQLPTGVCAITALQADGQPIGMSIGSFTSVSLDPPLVGFFPDHNSLSWPKIETTGRFCVNILSAEQEPVCRQLASKAANKFEGLSYRSAGSGAPILDGAVAWIDCDLLSVQPAGDHYIVLGAVRELQIETGDLPLLFFQGGYGRFSPQSLVAADPSGLLSEQLRRVDKARHEMERLCREVSAGCIATIRVNNDDLMIAACAGLTQHSAISALVGQRFPFLPPTGAIFAAWADERNITQWARTAGREPAELQGELEVVRRRGISIGLVSPGHRAFIRVLNEMAERPSVSPPIDWRDLNAHMTFDPLELTPTTEAAVRLVIAPVFDPDGQVALALSLFDFPKHSKGGLQRYVEPLLAAAGRVTARLSANQSRPRT
jgi:flavin reductase (DIM6/NTAB) family NADH-FMN oxidoreductase RutF